MNIFYNRASYPELRTIIDKTDNKYIFISRKKDFAYVLAKFQERLFNKSSYLYNRIWFRWRPVKRIKNGVVHTFNYLYEGNAPWVCTTEINFPSTHYKMESEDKKKYFQKVKKYILNEKCKYILPLSNFAKMNILKEASQYLNQQECEIISKKIHVLHPPQQILIDKNRVKRKFSNLSSIKMVFVGNDFWRKGGYITLCALQDLRNSYENFEFIIISNLNMDEKSYSTSKEEIINIINNNDWITWYQNISNNEVLDILKQCHIGLLPTYGDTYGYSILEMQASGCPVITSNNYALQEINSIDSGWFCDINTIVEEFGDDYFNSEICNITHIKMVEYLKNIIQDLLNSESEKILDKALNSLEKIKKEHSPLEYSKILNKIYSDAYNA